MAVTNFSPLLGLALPTTGDLSGTWGTVVNDSITQLLDSAVAGTTTLSVDTDVTLSTTNGAANQARNAIIRWTASNGATTRNITAPAQSKAYLVINAGTGSIVIRGSGPTTGVTLPAGTRALVAWSGSDFVKVASNPAVLTTDVSGALPIANGGTGATTQQAAMNALAGAQTANRVLRSDGTNTTLSQVALTTDVTGTLPVANGGTGVTASTGTGSNVLSASPALTGTPTAPTATVGTNTTQLATTAYVINQIGAIAAGVSSFSAGTTGLTPSLATSGAVTLAGTLSAANGGTGLTSPGASGNILTSDGTNWTTAAFAGGMTLITTLAPANGTTSITASSIPTIYQSIYVIATDITADNSAYLHVAFSADNGSNFFAETRLTGGSPYGRGVTQMFQTDLTAKKTYYSIFGSGTGDSASLNLPRTSSSSGPVNNIRVRVDQNAGPNTFSGSDNLIYIYGVL
jgi:hypothetical protein